MRLFEDARFSWESMAQFALVSPDDMPPPRLSFSEVERLFRPEEALGVLRSRDLSALLLPGPDGDFGFLLAHGSANQRAAHAVLAEECAAAGLVLSTVDEGAFMQTAWFGDEDQR
ncbi:hypothetical protein WMF30_56230 [Sorangium sp. So ce134]